jgi:UTP--glucose-1-phosphate uridylyltransferase
MTMLAAKSRIRKAVIPVAGRGSTLLPATRSVPKALLPIVDKPLAEFVVDEAVAAGIDHVIFVTPRNGNAVEDHFAGWRGPGRARVSFSSVRQSEPRGVGHALCCAETLLDGEPFALLLPDELILDHDDGIASCIGMHRETSRSVVAVEPITIDRTASRGVVTTEAAEHRLRITGAVDRPGPAHAQSLTGIVGRHVLTPAIFAALRATVPGAGGEISLVDALQHLLAHETVYAVSGSGVHIDCGTRDGLVQAVLEVALRDPELAPALLRLRHPAIHATGISSATQACDDAGSRTAVSDRKIYSG